MCKTLVSYIDFIIFFISSTYMIFTDNKEDQGFAQSQYKNTEEIINVLTEESCSNISEAIKHF